MRNATETTLRSLAMLQAIPVHPRSKSTRQIMEELRDLDPDFQVTARSVQRNLEKLSSKFPIASDAHGRSNHWYWMNANALTQIPAMSAPTALVLRLAAEHLKSVMPPSALRQLDAYFNHAEQVLGDTALGRWKEKATIIGRGPLLKPPTVRSHVQGAVYEALLAGQCLEVTYRNKVRKRSGKLTLNPLGLVVRDGLLYLVATARGYDDIRHYVLHRMTDAKPLDEAAEVPKGFRLARHIREDHRFSYPVTERQIKLKALFDPDAATHLTESRLATDHRTAKQQDGRFLVEATVSDTADLRWWLLGFGGAVEVLGPASLRAELKSQAQQMAANYGCTVS